METRANHVLIGLFTIIVAFSAVLFALWAAKYASDISFKEFDVVFREAITGLSKGSIVQYNGINVGEVRELSLDKADPNKVIVRVRVGADTPVKVDTNAKLAFIGLTGVAQIQLSGGTANSQNLRPGPNQEVAVINAKESALAKLLNSTEGITTTAADVLLRLNRVLSEKNVQHISKTLANLEAVTTSVSGERENIASLIRNLRQSSEILQHTLDTTDRTMTGIDQTLVAKLPELVRKLDNTLSQLESVGRNANDILVGNKDSLDSLSNEGLTQVGPALSDLRRLLRDLNRLSNRIEENPAKFVLGRGKPEEFQP